MSNSKPTTIAEQADFIERIVSRCTMRGGDDAGKTWHLFKAADVAMLRGIEGRLRRMAPHEDEIRKLVTGR